MMLPERNEPQPKRRRGRPRKTEGQSEHKLSPIAAISNPSNPMELIHHYRDMHFQEKEKTIKIGFTKNQLICVKNALKLDYQQLSKFLLVTQRAIHLRKNDDVLAPWINERISVLLELFCNAMEIFGNPEDTREWLISPTTLLSDRSPISIAGTHPGLLKVRELVYRMRLGHL